MATVVRDTPYHDRQGGKSMRTLVTLGLGALTMYLLDPEHGRRRRARMRDQLTHAKRVVNTWLERAPNHRERLKAPST